MILCCIFHQAEKFALSTNRGSKNISMMNQVQNFSVTWFLGFEWIGSKVVKQNDHDDSTSTEDWLVVSNIFLCSSLFGEMIQHDEHIFQMGWFNHQPEDCFYPRLFFVCQEVQVSSLKTLYSWVCVLKCTHTEATVHCFNLPFSSSNCCNACSSRWWFPSHITLFPIFSTNFGEGFFPFLFTYMKKIRSSPNLLQMFHS